MSTLSEPLSLDRRETIVLLFLLHHPCHPYEMAKHFRQAQLKGYWSVPKTADLGRANKTYKICSNLVRKGLLVPSEPEGGRRRVSFHVNCSPIFESVEHKPCILEDYEHIPFPKEGTIDRIHKETIEDCFKAIELLSYPVEYFLGEIAKIKIFDLTTFLVYLDVLLAEIEEFIRKYEPILDYEEGKLKDETADDIEEKATPEDVEAWNSFIHSTKLDWRTWIKRQSSRIKSLTSKEQFAEEYFHRERCWSAEGLSALQSFSFFWDTVNIDVFDFYDASVAVSDIRGWLGQAINKLIREERGLLRS